MPVSTIATTATDHIPQEFSIDELKAHGFTEEEISSLATDREDDPALLTMPDPDQAPAAAPDLEEDGVGAPPPEAPAQAPAPQAQAPLLPKVEIPDTTEAERVIAALDEKMASIQERYDDGELTRAELLAQTKAMQQEHYQAQRIIDQATEAVQTIKQSAVDVFYAAQSQYYDAGAGDLMKPEHLPAWDRHLREVTGNTAYISLNANQLITLAHQRYAAEYEVINGKPLPIAIPKAGPAKLERRTDPRPDGPQTLANVNGDLSAAMGDSRVAAIDQLVMKDPLEAEQQLARLAEMSPAEYDRYLQFV